MTEHEQFTTPEGGGELVDDEPDAVAVEAGRDHVGAAEETAMHIEDDEEAGGRTGDDSSGYVT